MCRNSSSYSPALKKDFTRKWLTTPPSKAGETLLRAGQTIRSTMLVLARALTDATVISIPPEMMEQWMGKYKSWYQFVLSSYRNRFESLLQTIDAIAFSTMDERLEFYLKRQVLQSGPVLNITHQQIANDLNSSREVISRLLKKMESRGLLELHRNSMEWKQQQPL